MAFRGATLPNSTRLSGMPEKSRIVIAWPKKAQQEKVQQDPGHLMIRGAHR